ncbi:MAG: SGNH/GDSL hydrolase family protein [Cocleimonas sp.]
MFNKLKLAGLLLMLVTLTACGGGSGDTSEGSGDADKDKNRTKTLRIATFGDSTANVSSVKHNVQVFNADLDSNTPEQGLDSRKYLISLYYPAAYLVGNGGISGDTTATMIARDELPASATRKATEDIIALKPQVVLFRGGSINDLQAITEDTTPAESVSLVNAIYAKHISLVEKFTIANIAVLDAGILGYSNSKVEGFGHTDPDKVRAALVALNVKFKTYAEDQTHDKVTFVDLVGVVSDSAGKYLPNMTYDGVHLSLQGGLAVAKEEAALIKNIFGESSSSSFESGGKNLYPAINATETERDNSLFDVWGDVNKRYIKTVKGKKYQFADFKQASDAASGGINIRLAPVMNALVKGKTYGISLDIIVENMDASEAKLSARLDLENNNGGKYRLTALSNSESVNDTLKGIKKFSGRMELPPLLLKSAVASSSSFIVHLSHLPSSNAIISVGVSALNIVELPPVQ